MRLLTVVSVIAALSMPSYGQIVKLTREQMIQCTEKNPFERFPDGRPKVPDSILERVKKISIEEAWGALRDKGYHHQFAGDFQILHPGKKLVGRAVTAQYLPLRPDLDDALVADATARGLAPGNTQRVVDVLRLNDVPVVALMGAAKGHNFGGDNMHAALFGVTRTGAVVDGTIRDLEGVLGLQTQVYFKKPHPAAVSEVSVVGINIPVQVSGAIVLPGDVVLGDRTGVIFIPPHLVEEIVEKAELIRIKDDWRKEKFLTGNYKAKDLYHGDPLTPELQQDLDAYIERRLAEGNK